MYKEMANDLTHSHSEYSEDDEEKALRKELEEIVI